VSSSRIQSLPPDRRTEIDLLAWLGQADAGDVLEYHHGFLALDRSPCGAVFKERDRVAIGQVASQAMRLGLGRISPRTAGHVWACMIG